MVELAAGEEAAIKVYKALGDPTRFRIIKVLAERGELGCSDLQAATGVSAPALSHHTRILQDCGLITLRREGPYHFFRLRRDQLARYAPALLAT
jgi:DNA-binding transcriptional ArsR family regulator